MKINKNSNTIKKSNLIVSDRSVLVKLFISILLIFLTGLFAQFRFFIPGNPVPITFQTMGILLIEEPSIDGLSSMKTLIIESLSNFRILENSTPR